MEENIEDLDIQEDFIDLSEKGWEEFQFKEDENDFPDLPEKEDRGSERLRRKTVLL